MERHWVELAPKLSAEKLLKLFVEKKGLNIIDLKDGESCLTLKLGKVIGSGLNGKIYQIEDEKDGGVEVVVKTILLKDTAQNTNGVLIMHETLSEIVMSSFFNKLYSNPKYYSVNFPYFKGFFACGNQARLVMEKLDLSFFDYLIGKSFTVKEFSSLMFQLSFSLLLLKKEKIMHNDLHTRNLMLVKSKNRKYKAISLNQSHFYYKEGNKVYKIPNHGHILKFVDFDFAAKHSEPKVCPRKLWTRPMDLYNVQYQWRPNYDLMVIIMFTIHALYNIKSPGPEVTKAKILLEEWIKDLTMNSGNANKPSKYFFKQFVAKFNPTVNRPLPGQELMLMNLRLDFWNMKHGIEKVSEGKQSFVGLI